MTDRQQKLPDASDIGLEVTKFRRETPLWEIYEAELSREKMVAWRFLPAHLRPASDGSALWPRIPDWVAKGNLPTDRTGVVPRKAGYSEKSASGWLVYPDDVRKVEWPVRDRQALADLVNKLLNALDRLHGQNTLHLDVHPSNIRSRAGAFCLIGMGADIRKAAGDATGSNDGLARRQYAAPEMWDASGRSQLGPWTDIFGAAATLHFTICGKAPADFRERIGNPGWRDQMTKDLNAALAASGGEWPKMVEFILAGLAPAIADRPRTVAEWSHLWRPSEDGPGPEVLPAQSSQSGLQNLGVAAAGFFAGGLLFYLSLDFLFFDLASPEWGAPYLVPILSSYGPLLSALIFQIAAILSLDKLLPSLPTNARRGFLLPAVLALLAATWSMWGGMPGWVDWFNLAGCIAIAASLSPRHSDGRHAFLSVATILTLLAGIFAYFYIEDASGLAAAFRELTS